MCAWEPPTTVPHHEPLFFGPYIISLCHIALGPFCRKQTLQLLKDYIGLRKQEKKNLVTVNTVSHEQPLLRLICSLHEL